jgi:anti-sigma regulatory factor (Ser/Thr protein kinase)
VAEDFAIRTVPREGIEVTKGTRVRLLVSNGPEQVTVPDVTGLSRDSAENLLTGEGLEVAVEERESEEPEDEVIAQNPVAGTELERGETVTITVSTGIEEVTVPDVIGLAPREAARQLRAAGLVAVQTETDVTDPSQDGVVIEQRPAPGTDLEKGSQVTIVSGVLIEDDLVAPGDPEALAEARHMVRAAVAAWGARDRSDEIELVADELITNALMHTEGSAIVTLRTLTSSERRLRVEVEDSSSALPRRREAGESGVSGRGLLLVETLTDVWGVEARGGGKCVWSEFVVAKQSDTA